MAEGVIRAALKTGRRVLVGWCCLLALATVAGARSKPVSRNMPARAVADSRVAVPDSQFVIGDFDGDRQLDLATVELSRFNALRSRYSISFQLSSGGPQTIGVTGPAGGLAMVAQDVNGDRALDLILVTAWRHELVAVLLNDGHGHFSSAEPQQFEIDAILPASCMGIAWQVREDRTALSIQNSLIADSGETTFAMRPARSRFARTRLIAFTSFFSPLSGRAPPANVFLPV